MCDLTEEATVNWCPDFVPRSGRSPGAPICDQEDFHKSYRNRAYQVTMGTTYRTRFYRICRALQRISKE